MSYNNTVLPTTNEDEVLEIGFEEMIQKTEDIMSAVDSMISLYMNKINALYKKNKVELPNALKK